MDSRTRGPRLDALTGLRYIAALTVLLAHMSGGMPGKAAPKYLQPLSGIGMPLFFVLSGFLMAYNYSAAFQAGFRRTVWSFYVARLARIYPIYIIILLIYFSFVGNFFHDWKFRRHDTVLSLAFVGTLTQSWVHIPVFIDYMHPRTVAQSYMGVAWSVSTEAFFYLLFPAIVLPLARYVTRAGHLVVGGGLVMVACLVADYLLVRSARPDELAAYGAVRWLTYLSPYMRLGEFLTGAMLGQYYLRHGGRVVRSGRGWWAGAAGLAGAVALLIGLNYWFFAPATVLGLSPAPRWLIVAANNILYAPLCMVVIYMLAALPSACQRLMGCRLMVLLGEASYCIYLAHPLLQSFYHPRLAGEGPLTNKNIVIYNHLAMVVVLHFLCLGLYRYAEVPLRAVVRNLLDRRPDRSAVVAVIPAIAPAGRRLAG